MKLLWNYYIIHRIHVIVHYNISICIFYFHTFSYFPTSFAHIIIKLSTNIDIGTWAPPIAIFESFKMSSWKFCHFNDMHVIVSNPFKRHIIITFSHSNLVLYYNFTIWYELIWQLNDRFLLQHSQIIFFQWQTCKYARIPFLNMNL